MTVADALGLNDAGSLWLGIFWGFVIVGAASALGVVCLMGAPIFRWLGAHRPRAHRH